jgi:hypothetical protein
VSAYLKEDKTQGRNSEQAEALAPQLAKGDHRRERSPEAESISGERITLTNQYRIVTRFGPMKTIG